MYKTNIFHKKTQKTPKNSQKTGKKTPFFSNSCSPAHKGPWAVFLLPCLRGAVAWEGGAQNRSITCNGVNVRDHTHVSHSAYGSQFASRRWDHLLWLL